MDDYIDNSQFSEPEEVPKEDPRKKVEPREDIRNDDEFLSRLVHSLRGTGSLNSISKDVLKIILFSCDQDSILNFASTFRDLAMDEKFWRERALFYWNSVERSSRLNVDWQKMMEITPIRWRVLVLHLSNPDILGRSFNLVSKTAHGYGEAVAIGNFNLELEGIWKFEIYFTSKYSLEINRFGFEYGEISMNYSSCNLDGFGIKRDEDMTMIGNWKRGSASGDFDVRFENGIFLKGYLGATLGWDHSKKGS